MGAIADLIKESKVHYLGVSEVGADLLRRAHRIHPVSALEIEYSLACRFIEAEILPTAREFGIAVVPYRILADGLLTGTVSARGSAHYVVPRMEGENLKQNLKPVEALKALAAVRGYTPAQLAVAWLLSKGDDIVPILGMSRPERVAENLQTLDLMLTHDELVALDSAFSPDAIIGNRYPDMVMDLAAK